jgi:hypothetical protein
MSTRPKALRMVLRRGAALEEPEITNAEELRAGEPVRYTDEEGNVHAIHVIVPAQASPDGKDIVVGYGAGRWNATVTHEDLESGRVKLEREPADAGHAHEPGRP